MPPRRSGSEKQPPRSGRAKIRPAAPPPRRTRARARCPTRPISPSSNSRPRSVMPCGTRRGGVNFGSGFAGSGAQSLRASDTSTNPARSVSDGWPVKLVMVSCSSRSDGTSSTSTSRKMRAISSATLRRSRSACTKSTAERKRAWRNRFGHASLTCTLSVPELVVEREFLERRRALREQNRHQRAVRPVGQRDLLQLHPELLHRLHRRAIDVGRRALPSSTARCSRP